MILTVAGKGIVGVLVAATLALAGWVRTQDKTQAALVIAHDALQRTVAQLKTEGTDVCKLHNMTDIALKGEVQHMQETQAEVRTDVKDIQRRLSEQRVIQEKILTKLESITDSP